jgi:type VI secretion system protein ImpM
MELSMSSRPLGAWLFGKLPAHGDFVARGLDPALRDALDAWLSSEVATARAQAGEGFEARYDQAPLVKFVDRDTAGRFSGGVLCASMDSVGRRFPLLVAIPAVDASAARTAADACEQFVYDAFAAGHGADDLHARLGSAAAPAVANDDRGPRWWVEGDPAEIELAAARFPAGLLPELLRLVA